MVTATRLHVNSNRNDNRKTNVSTQIEADTLMILHAAELSGEGKIVNFLTQDTDVLLLTLRLYELLGLYTAMML